MQMRWESGTRRALLVIAWVAYAVGVFLSFFSFGVEAQSILAAVFAGLYILGLQATGELLISRRWVQDVAATLGVLVLSAAISLTGGAASPYLLLSLLPVILAAVLGGYRSGVTTALLAIAAYVLAALGTGTLTASDAVLWSVLIILVGVATAYARNLLAEAKTREAAYQASSAEAVARLERLSRAHRFLNYFAAEAQGAELNPVSVGNRLLEDVLDVVPQATGGLVALAGDQGPVVVARAGSGDGAARELFTLEVGGNDVGFLTLFVPDRLDTASRQTIGELVEPVGLAFANTLLLQEIARRAVKEERQRLARDLHDEIGPSLASLGLAVDLALLRHPSDPDLAQHLHQLRNSVEGIVEDVRATVADLRMDPQPSISEVANRLAADVPPHGPAVDVRIQEVRPPRPAIAGELAAILAEAFRNAVAHSRAQNITVYGKSDFDEGSITVHDDGTGFRLDEEHPGRFGLIGMRERADRIGAVLDIQSTRRGTSVTVAWGPE